MGKGWIKSNLNEISIYILIFLSAFIIRIINLGKIITIDTIIWFNRYQQFTEAVFTGNFKGTYLYSHPGVTSMWISGLTLRIKGLVFPIDHLIPANSVNPLFNPENINQISFYSHLPQIIIVSLTIVLIYYLLKRITRNQFIPLTAALLLSFSPAYIGYNAHYLNQDTMLSCFGILTILFFIIYLKENKMKFLILSGILFGLSMLTKFPAITMSVGVFIILTFKTILSNKKERKKKIKKNIIDLTTFIIVGIIIYFLLWPALWFNASETITTMKESILGFSNDFEHRMLFFGEIKNMKDINGLYFYIIMLSLKLTPIVLLFSLTSLFYIFRKKSFIKELDYAFYLLIFALSYLIILSLGNIKYHWYITFLIPIFVILASVGINKTISLFTKNKVYIYLILTIIILLQLISALSFYPYYSLYHSPIWGSYEHSSELFTSFGGQGIEKTAEFLNQQPDIQTSRVSSWYRKMIYFRINNQGNSTDLNGFLEADYVVFPKNQIEHNYRPDVSSLYFGNFKPIYTVEFKNVELAWVFKNPENIKQIVSKDETGNFVLNLTK